MWCDISEPVIGLDKDGDGEASGDSTFTNDTQPEPTEEVTNELY